MSTPLIVLTVGTDSHPFDRAVRWVDAWAASHPEARVVAQWGTSTPAVHARGDELLPRPELDALVRDADAVVSHGGPATLHQIRQVGLLPLCVPRDPLLGEHVDDHQQRFARHQAARGRIRHVEDEASLHAALDQVVQQPGTLRIDPTGDASVAEASVARFAAFVDAVLNGDQREIGRLHQTASDDLHREAPRVTLDLPTGSAGPSPRIVYIGGWGRSGSTLLARLLGEHPEMTFVGELRDLWHRGVAENRLCGCGAPFFECTFWSAVGERAFGGWGAVPVELLQRLRDTVDKPWWVPLYRRGIVPPPVADDLALYVDLLTRVTRAMQAEVGPDAWIIDSSKIPSFAWLLGRIPELELRTIHLVRDARGSVYSWQKSVRRTDDPDARGEDAPMMLQYNPLNASARYVVYNRQAEGLAAASSYYVRTRYEDLVTEPERELDRIVDRLDLPGWDNGQLQDGRIRLGPSHSVVGNPMRMDTGWIPLRPDTAWRQEMDPNSRRLVSTVTGTTLRRYDYGAP